MELVVGGLFLVLGMFWAGRESDHGLAAFWEHWWCPVPLVIIVVGIAAVLAARPFRPAS
jgi:hypothetical protein